MKILVVEDDGYRIHLFTQWLRGYPVTVATSARRAIRLLRKEHFDIVFLDHDLGGRTFVDSSDRNTGAEVARFMAADGIAMRTVIHSQNAAGIHYIRSILPHARVVPFGPELNDVLHELLHEVVEPPPL